MTELIFSDPAADAYVSHETQFHGHVSCRYNECAHNRWEPRAGNEKHGEFVCALTSLPLLGEICPHVNYWLERDMTKHYRCLDYEPTRQHKCYKQAPSKWSGCTTRRGRRGDGSYSGMSGIDELGMCYADFGIPVWGSD